MVTFTRESKKTNNNNNNNSNSKLFVVEASDWADHQTFGLVPRAERKDVSAHRLNADDGSM